MNLSGDAGSLENVGGVVAGAFARIRLTEALALQPELLYVQKGARGRTRISADDEELTDVDYNLDYIELPLVATLAIPLSERFGTRAGVGPYAALSVRKETETDAPTEELITADQFESFDFGLVGAASFEFDVRGHALLLGARYDFGLADLFEDPPSEGGFDTEISTQSLIFTVGFLF